MNFAKGASKIVFLCLVICCHVATGYPCRDPGVIAHARRLFQRGNRLVQYICDVGYEAFGNPLLSCTRGRWQDVKPVCVAPGCPPVEDLRNGVKVVKHNGAVLLHTCNEGYNIIGSSILYCDGHRWNAARPVCRAHDSHTAPLAPENTMQPLVNNPIQNIPIAPRPIPANVRPTTATKTTNITTSMPHAGMNSGVLQFPNQRSVNPNFMTQNILHPNARNRLPNPTVNPPEGYRRPNYNYMPIYNRYNPYGPRYLPHTQQAGNLPNRNQAVMPAVREIKWYLNHTNKVYRVSVANNMYNPNSRRPYMHNSRTQQIHLPLTVQTEVNHTNSFPLRRGGHNQIPKRSRLMPLFNLNKTIPGINSHNDTMRQFPINEARQNVYSRNQNRNHQISSIKQKNSQPTLVQQRHLVCPRPMRIARGYLTTHPLPADYSDDQYVYYIQYHCLSGLSLVGGDNISYCQSNGQWSGRTPKCAVLQKCDQGFVQGDDGACTDANECNYNNGGCSHVCHNFIGGFYCSCQRGYQLQQDQSCMDINECEVFDQACMFDCVNIEGSFYCQCISGFVSHDNITCSDIDECAMNQHECMDTCINTVGSYLCKCFDGRQLQVDGITCIDDGYGIDTNNTQDTIVEETIAECDGRSYINVQTNTCIPCPTNSVILEGSEAIGIADCVCQPGYHGNPELLLPCTDFNECSDGNYGCSHVCVNTDGGAHCNCPTGYELDTDGRLCTDTNECKDSNVCENGVCSNTRGSYQCICYHGYQAQSDHSSCIDINECEIENGGCSDICKNYQGGFRCACPGSARLLSNGKSCQAVSHVCSPLMDPEHGHVLPARLCQGDYPITIGRVCIYTCSHGYQVQGESRRECGVNGWSGEAPSCLVTEFCPPLARPNNTEIIPKSCYQQPNLQWQLCLFVCKSGFVLVGKLTMRCGPNQIWDGKPSYCVRKYPQAPTVPPLVPMIQCPPDIDVALMDGSSFANVTVLGPVSNMNIIEQENDGRASRNTFPAGTTIVHFTAFSVDRSQQASCDMKVNVRDISAPVIQRCPGSISVISNEEYGNITWEEPLFSDNVRLHKVRMSRVPSGQITWGTYRLTYIASDAAGNKAECSFSVTVRSSTRCNNINRPLNGRLDCRHWLKGKYCEVSCNAGYTFDHTPAHVYVCTRGKWSPTNRLPNCLSQNSNLIPSSTTTRPTETVLTHRSHQLFNNSSLALPSIRRNCGPGSEAVRINNRIVRCKLCEAGYYKPNVRAVLSCIPCPRGFYQESRGMGYCERCPNYEAVQTNSSIPIMRGFASLAACSMLGGT
ncbi:LOW QUALITY PROTEIN: uncharacterized protein LOC100178466 [Ciona intestinalis]